MKSLTTPLAYFSLFLFLHLSSQQILPICVLEQGCIANVTNLEAHLHISDHSPLEFKKTQWILLFADKLVLTFENNTIKSLSYGEIPLDCGPENNKFCTVSEYQSKFPDQMVAKSTFIRDLCFVLPSIFSEKVTYLCQTKGSNQIDMLDRLNIISRLIDNYQMKMLHDTENPLNRFPRRHHNVFYLDANRLVLANVKLFPNNIQGFVGERLLFDWDFKSLSAFKPINMLTDATKFREVNEKQLKTLEAGLNHSKSLKKEDCLVIFSNNEPKYLCSKNNHSLISIKENVASSLGRMRYLKDFELLSTIAKAHNYIMVFDPYMREMASLRNRIFKLETYDSLFCLHNRRVVSEKLCMEAKQRDVNDEIFFLSQNSDSIFSSLKQSKKPRVLRFKQRMLVRSFLQIDPAAPAPNATPTDDQLKKSQVFKKKVMENLQKNRRWTISQDERAKGDFKKKSDADPFVTYLGYIRDSSMSSIKAQEQKLLNS